MSQRLIDPNGTFNIEKRKIPLDLRDIYHSLLSLKLPVFFALLAGLYVAVNLIFGWIYWLLPDGQLAGIDATGPVGRFLTCFFFSVQTVGTIGYGNVHPVGLAANWFVTLEAFAGMTGTALATGLLFARFARPTARVVFSRQALIVPHDGVLSLVFRIANARLNQIVEAKVRVTLARDETTAEGEKYRSLYDLKLERDTSPFFAMSWTVVHPIDAASPLRGVGPISLRESGAEVIVSVTGIDDTFSQTIHAWHSYTAKEIRWSGRFRDMISRGVTGKLRLELEKIHELHSE